MSEDLRYPTGRYVRPEKTSIADRKDYIERIRSLPTRLQELVEQLSEDRLNERYRPEGWTVRQVVHHIADSHMNAFIRFKLALSEDVPVVKPYDEADWAELPDARNSPIGPSLGLIDGLHRRWVDLLNSMRDEDYEKRFLHPETKRESKLWEVLALYAWHGDHHLGHIRLVTDRQ